MEMKMNDWEKLPHVAVWRHPRYGRVWLNEDNRNTYRASPTLEADAYRAVLRNKVGNEIRFRSREAAMKALINIATDRKINALLAEHGISASEESMKQAEDDSRRYRKLHGGDGW